LFRKARVDAAIPKQHLSALDYDRYRVSRCAPSAISPAPAERRRRERRRDAPS
jgi:hypothetical protein